MPARDVGGTTNRDSLSACYPDGAAMLVEVNATAMTELLLVRLITKIREVIASLLVRNEVQQTQELVVNAARGRHAQGQKRHSAIVAIWIPILTNLFGSSLRKNLVGPIRVVEHAMALPTIATSTNEVMTDSGIGNQVVMLQHTDARDLDVSTAFAFAGHHLLDFRGITCFLANATEGIERVIMSTVPIRAVSVAAVNVIAITASFSFIPNGLQGENPQHLNRLRSSIPHTPDAASSPRARHVVHAGAQGGALTPRRTLELAWTVP